MNQNSYTLKINIDDVSRYLGFRGEQLDEVTALEVEKVVALLQKEITYQFTYKVFSIEKGETIHLDGTNLELEGNDMQTLLGESEQCILLAVTLGQKVDELIRKAQVLDLQQSVLLDVCASSMVEELCNQIETDLTEEWQKKGMYLTDRFSPGYGDLPLSIQGNFCKVLDTNRKIGLHVSKEYIMMPRKSITAILGISHKEQPMRIKGCAHCRLFEDCQFRKVGKTCG